MHSTSAFDLVDLAQIEKQVDFLAFGSTDSHQRQYTFPFLQVMNRLEWFDWARYSVIDYLFPFGWYNWDITRDFEYKKGFTADTMASKVLAMARFRQLRVKKGTDKESNLQHSALCARSLI